MTDYDHKSGFFMCSVRNVSEEEKDKIEYCVKTLEDAGYVLHFPPRNTNQNDSTGYNICMQNMQAIQNSYYVFSYWNPKSEGSIFDLGNKFMKGGPLLVVNKKLVKPTEHKSFTNVILEMDNQWRPIVKQKDPKLIDILESLEL